jgi:Tol biopolymer transport system component
LVLAVGGVVLWRYFYSHAPQTPPANPADVTLQFTTERGEGATEGIVNSPMRIAVRMPWSNGSQKGTVSEITARILDEAGKPAQFGEETPETLSLRPTIDINVWEYVGSVPGRPGKYHILLHLEAPYDPARQQDYTFSTPQLTALADTAPALNSGFVFNTEGNLWVMSTDAASQRRLTYYSPMIENSDSPAWSPDAALIAYAFTPQQPSDQVPGSDIWVIKPDRSGARQVASHGPNESLLYPSWSADGKYLYYTVEGSNDNSSPMGLPAVPNDNRRVERLDLATGVHQTLMPSAQMASQGGPDGDIVYLEIAPAGPDTDPSTVPQRLVRSHGDSSGKKQLLDEKAFGILYAPRLSPDGKWVIFAATNSPIAPKSGFDPLRWLGFVPETVSAHVVPWDIYLVPAEGGSPTRLTHLDEDQPYPTWMDNATIAFMGATGLYKQAISPDGRPAGEPVKLHPGSLHGGLTWHAP